MKFHDYKIYETYESKPYYQHNDNLKNFNGNYSSETVCDFRLNLTSSVLKNINKDYINDSNLY
jgi:hypothetical protein